MWWTCYKIVNPFISKVVNFYITCDFFIIFYTEAVVQRCSVKNVFLEISQNSQENTCAQVFSCEFCEISKNTFFHGTPLVAASGSNIFLHFTVMSHVHILSNAHNSSKNQFEFNQRHGNNISFKNIVSICVLFLLASSYNHILLFRHIVN